MTAKRRKARGSKKGSPFERKIAKLLSLWWTGGERDDVFWRSTTSGARATQRGKSGRGTHGQHGDLTAQDPSGEPFIQACCVELKVGYGKWSTMDAVDRGSRSVEQDFEKFLDKAYRSHDQAGATWPVLITKRDMRQALLTIPFSLYGQVRRHYGALPQEARFVVSRVDKLRFENMVTLLLDVFLEWCPPEFFAERMWKPKRTRRG